MLLLLTITSSLWLEVDRVNFVTFYAHAQTPFFAVTGQISLFLSHLEEGLLVPQSEALIQVYKGFPFAADIELFATSSWKYGGNMQECYLLHRSGCLM